MNLEEILRLLENARPALAKLDKDGKQTKAFYEDWAEALKAAEGDPQAFAALAGIPAALMLKAPKKFSFNFDPFKPVRLMADDFARAGGFERYKKLRNL